MKKIPALLVIDHPTHEVLDTINPAARFIFSATNVVATVKRDGQAMKLTDDGAWLTRRAVKDGKTTPAGFVAEQHDPNTGTTFGWEPVEQSSVIKAFKDALAHHDGELNPGTFELAGPKIQGNPEKLAHHVLFVHGSEVSEFPNLAEIAAADSPKSVLLPLFTQFRDNGVEGVVLWADGVPAVKVRVKDIFGGR